ncbi:MAG: MFS transporter [Acidiferrobacteraceae bacterium]|nr:MFS transporter [Acidiferrobacteraceae bacterium]
MGLDSDRQQDVPYKHPIRWLVLTGVWLLYAVFGVSIASLPPLVSTIEADIGIGHGAMGSVLGAWQFVYILAAIPCGVLLDRIGGRRAFIIGSMLIAASMLSRSFVSDYTQLLVSVGLFGLGGPIISAGAPKIIAEWFEGKERGLAMGIYITGPGMGAIVALSLTNSLFMPMLDGDWRALLRIWGALAVIATLVWFAISRFLRLRGEESRDVSNPVTSISRMIGLPTVRLVLLMSISVFFFVHGMENWLPELLRAGGMRLDQAGFWAAVPVLVAILGALTIPRLALPHRRVRILLFLFLSAGAASVLLQYPSGPSLWGGLLLEGIARSSMMTILILILVEIDGVGKKRAGTAGGLFFSVAEIGGVGGPLVLGLLYEVTGTFSLGLIVMTANCTLLVVALSLLRRHSSA